MKLYHDETTTNSATKFWIVFNNRKVELPVRIIPYVETNPGFGDVDLDTVEGTYELYSHRVEDHQLNWSQGPDLIIREGQELPTHNPEYSSYSLEKRFRISGLKHDGISILKNGVITLL